MKKFQVFYEGDGVNVGGATGETQTVVTEPSTSNGTDNNTSGTDTNNNTGNPDTSSATGDRGSEEQGGFAIVVDPRTGIRELKPVNSKKVEDVADKPKDYVVPTTPTTPVQVPNENKIPGQEVNANNNLGLVAPVVNPQQPQAPAEYTPQDFAIAMQMNMVDESRIPAAYRQQYAELKVRKEMAAAQSNPNLNGEQQLPQGQQPVNKQPDMTAFYEKVDGLAKEKALKDVGLTAEELAAGEYTDDETIAEKLNNYKTAVQWHKNDIIIQVQNAIRTKEQQAGQQKAMQETIYRDIGNYVKDLSAKEPNFEKIDVYMASRYKSLPYEQAKTIADTIAAYQNKTITPEGCEILKKYYEDTRLDFYAQNNNLKTAPTPAAKPQVVEQPGTGATSVPEKIDFSELAKADNRGKDAFLAKIFGNRK